MTLILLLALIWAANSYTLSAWQKIIVVTIVLVIGAVLVGNGLL